MLILACWHAGPGVLACISCGLSMLVLQDVFHGEGTLHKILGHVGPGVLACGSWCVGILVHPPANFHESFLYFLEFLKVKVRGTSAMLSAFQTYYEMWPMVRSAKNNYFLATVLNCHKSVALAL